MMKGNLMNRFKWGKKELIGSAQLEGTLDAALRPVNPRPEFIRRLRSRIIADFQPKLAEAQNERKMVIVLFSASLAGAVLAALIGVRMVITLIGTIGLMMQMKKPARPESFAVVNRIS